MKLFEEEPDASTQNLQTRKNQIFVMQNQLERFFNVPLVIGFNSAKYYISLIKNFLLPLVILQ